MLTLLTCFPTFYHSAIPTSCHMLELKFATNHRTSEVSYHRQQAFLFDIINQ